MEDKISIILPIFNVGPHLRGGIDSLINQTIGNENLEIYFKTDDDNLFEESLKYFEEEGFEVKEKTYDLHKNDIIGGNIITEHEEMFTNQGIKIKALIATL